MKKVNLKAFQGKPRIYLKQPGAPGIHRILVWDDDRKEYAPPQRGKLFYARRYEFDQLGMRKRALVYFDTLEDARAWQAHGSHTQTIQSANSSSQTEKIDLVEGPTLRDIVDEWKSRKFSGFSSGTRIHYEQLIDLHFGSLMDLRVNAITPKTVDAWLAERKANVGQTWQSRNRKSFDHELTLLTVILRYYGEYHDEDTAFRLPIKDRHRKDSKLNVDIREKSKDLTEAEFYRFRNKLVECRNGPMLAALAAFQFFQALRISEATALHWEDIKLNWKDPKESRVLIVRHVVFSRKTGMRSEIVAGFKNSKANGGTKELPIFPGSFDALKSIHAIGKKGLVFHDEEGNFFEYSLLRNAYNRAFKKAGLPYSATHVMRHGRARAIVDETGGDFAVAGQILGNTDMQTIQTYAKRHKGALTKVAHELWRKHEEQNELAAFGRKSKAGDVSS